MQHLVVQVNGQEVPFQVRTAIDEQEVLANLAVPQGYNNEKPPPH